MHREFVDLTIKEQVAYVWIDYIRYNIKEIYETTELHGYATINNEILSEINKCLNDANYDKIYELCKDGMRMVKGIDGNSYRIWLFYMLECILKSDMTMMNDEKKVALSCELDDLKKYHSHRLLKFRWYEPNY